MKAKIYDWHTEIYPTPEEVKEYCKPGSGADTCSWLVLDPYGWRCVCREKSNFMSLLDKHRKGELVAMRDGCEKVNTFRPYEYTEECEVEF